MMTSGRYGPALRQIGRLLGGGSVASQGSQHLLERFAATSDESAFEALIHQHGPMVLGTCRRMLTDPHDVEDAFQATFLVLARRAGTIQDADRLGPWLHGVARRVASRSRALSARRNSLRRTSDDEPSAEAPGALEAAELRAALDEELASLPDKYRAPLVLCYLEGLTHDEAAQQLRWPVGTVRSRLAGGRERLRARLTRRGLAPTAAVPMILARAAIPQALLSATVRVATSTGTVPAHVATLAKGVLVAMIWNKLKLIAAVGLMAGLTVGGAGVAAQYGGQGKGGAEVESKTTAPATGVAHDGDGKADLHVPVEADRIEKEIAAEKLKKKQLLIRMEKLDQNIWALKEQDSKELLPQIAALEDEGKGLGIDGRISDTTVELLSLRLQRLNARKPRTKADQATTKPAPEVVENEEPKVAAPSLSQLGEGWVVSIPSEKDRVTVLNTETGFRTTHRFPSKLTSLLTLAGGNRLLAFLLEGPEVRHILVFSFDDKKWYPHDLKEPVTRASPLVSPEEVSYELGRFFYTFSRQAKKWATLELKRGKVQNIRWVIDQQTGKRTYQEGTVLHTYDPKTGDWTDFDTNGPDTENPASNLPKDNPGPNAKPAANVPKTGTKPPEPQASIYSLLGNPTLFSVFGPSRDRVTMINSETLERSTFQLAQPAEYVHPVAMGTGNVIALSINGKGITRTAVFDRLSSRWSEHDWYAPVAEIHPWPDPSTRFKATPVHPLIGFTELAPVIRRLVVFDSSNGSWNEQELREPVKDALKVGPTINETMAVYFIDRFVYIYSSPAKKWSVLEGKQKIWPVNWMQQTLDSSGRMAFNEADVIHLYDPKTGDWTHIDTKDEK